MLRTLERWLADPSPKIRKIVYHTGHLASDRQANPELDRAADLLVRAGEVDWPMLSACSHVRGTIHGSRRVRLTQAPGRPGEGWVYIAERLS